MKVQSAQQKCGGPQAVPIFDICRSSTRTLNYEIWMKCHPHWLSCLPWAPRGFGTRSSSWHQRAPSLSSTWAWAGEVHWLYIMLYKNDLLFQPFLTYSWLMLVGPWLFGRWIGQSVSFHLKFCHILICQGFGSREIMFENMKECCPVSSLMWWHSHQLCEGWSAIHRNILPRIGNDVIEKQPQIVCLDKLWILYRLTRSSHVKWGYLQIAENYRQAKNH